MLTREEQELRDMKFLAGEMFDRPEPWPNLDPEAADRKHVQGVLDRHEAGTLVDVLTCNEDVDGAVWSVLLRNAQGLLVRADVYDEPGYSNLYVRATY